MNHKHKYFSRGRMTDGDSGDMPGDALSESINADLRAGPGMARIRPGLEHFTLLGNLPVGSSGYTYPAEPNGGDWWLYDGIQWDSGITTVQPNSLLVYRERDASGDWEDAYILFSNAPLGGDGGSWQLLTEAALSVPYCRLDTMNGQVRVRMGPANDYMILMNLCEEGSRVLPNLTVTTSTTPSPQLAPGAGGNVYAGWLWDWGKLYWSATSSNTYTVTTPATGGQLYPSLVAAGARAPLEKCGYVGAIVPVYDDYDEQYGIPYFFTIDKQSWAFTDAVIKITFNISDDSLNKRITKFAIYGQKVDRTNYIDNNELGRLLTVPVASLTSSYDVYIDDSLFDSIEGVWSADSKGRPITLHAGDKTGSLAGIWTLPPLPSYVDDEISVKCSGVMLRRKRAFAWGINGDPGQSRFAISQPDDNTTGQLDVFWKLNRIWRDGSRATTWAMEWYDRMFLWNAHNSYWIDLELRLDDQTMTLDTGFGIGTSMVRTIAKGATGLFWANTNSVYRFSTGAPLDLCLNVWRDEWLAIDETYKTRAVAGYCNYRSEYWLAVQTDTNQHTVYVWSDVHQNWRAYRFGWNSQNGETEIIPHGFLNDAEGRFLMYGQMRSAGTSFLARFDGTEKRDLGLTIELLIVSHDLGERDQEMVLDRIDLQRTTDANSENMHVDLYVDEFTDASATVIFPPTRKKAVRVRRGLRCNSYRFGIRASLSDESAVRPAIKQISIDTTDDIKRSQ